MPYKHNESRRHKIEKSRYKVTNWHDYNNGLQRRGGYHDLVYGGGYR